MQVYSPQAVIIIVNFNIHTSPTGICPGTDHYPRISHYYVGHDDHQLVPIKLYTLSYTFSALGIIIIIRRKKQVSSIIIMDTISNLSLIPRQVSCK